MKIEVEQIQCNFCEHKWIKRIDNPASCPKCKRYDYDKVRVKSKK